MLKKLFSASVLGAVTLIFAVSTAMAFQCPGLIRQAREALGKSALAKADKDSIEKMVAEAQDLHGKGQHQASIDKVNEALKMLGVKK
ncbi:MAG: hypothetical protein HYY65_11960 [Candidatus Tectomicrobia bacterium]|uniref:Uncharacterized protein n=1 Tax=Tectimicrobiota bacterium TaxID=2528274 RepID=A0A932M172_UNCTE|nr:hypothetical protein [Candidatus Tectomicrobia bacterium]